MVSKPNSFVKKQPVPPISESMCYGSLWQEEKKTENI